MRHFSYLSIMFILLAGLICCATETESSSSSSSSYVEPVSTTSTTVYSISHVEFDSLSYILTADTDASDDKVFTMTVNNQSVTAKANKGRLSADLSKCWTNANKGGKQYEVTFSAANAGVNPSKVNIDYWPKAVCELKCASEIAIYNGSSSAYQSPQFTLNYEADTYDYTMSFIVKDRLDNDITRTIPGIATWQLSNMLTYLKETDHFGYSVKVTATVTPKRNGIPQTALQSQVSVTYISCKDVLAAKVRVEHYYNYYIAVTYDKDDNPAGGDIKYEWQVSDNQQDWLSMLDTESVLEITKNNLGKYLRCIITQTYEGKVQASITSEAIMLNNIISAAYLHYDGIVLYGNNPTATQMSGTAVDVFGGDLKNLTFSFENLSAGMKSSDYVTVKVSKENYEDYITSVFVNVQNVLSDSEIIPLSTDVRNIPTNKAKFTDTSSDIECSFDNGATWAAMPTDAFDAKLGTLILLRKKEIGTVNQKGYIMASEPKPISVVKENIGLPIYTVNAQAQYDAAKDEITVEINAPDGALFDVILNDHAGDVHAYQGKLTFSAASFFTSNDECGRDYTIEVSADDAIITNSQATVSYWPKAKVALNSEQNVVIWTGNERSTVPVPAYTLNYANDKCDVTISYEIKYITDAPIEVSTSGWTIDSMIDYIFDNAHTGQAVEIHFKAVPKKDNQPQNALASEWTMTYSHFQDELIASAEIVKKYNSTNGYYFAITSYDSSNNEAGGSLAYAWEIADDSHSTDWTPVDSSADMIHPLIQSEVGKYLRCTVIQTYEGASQTPVTTSPFEITSVIKSASLTYSEVVEEGTIPDSSKLSGSFVSIFGDNVALQVNNMNFSDEVKTVEYTDIDDAEYSMSVPNFMTDGLLYSMYVPVKITKDGYDDTHDIVFINVKSKLRDDEMPALVTDVWTVTKDKVKFNGNHYALEYKLNDAAEWNFVTSDEFSATVNDVIHIRKRLWGVEGIVGCLKESDERTITVTAANIGTKTNVSGISAEVKSVYLDLNIHGENFTDIIEFDAILRNTDGLGNRGDIKYKYTWKVDGVLVQDTDYLYLNNTNENYIYLDKRKMIRGEVYQVSVLVEVYNWHNDTILVREFAQKGVEVE